MAAAIANATPAARGKSHAVDAAKRAPRVVIDPGHGGSNPGALGASGIHEKDLTLAIARGVQSKLLAQGIDARLTRDRDRTMTLRQRMADANEWPADILVSIHANASPTRTQRGYETYVLTPTAVDVDARALRSDTPTPRPGVDRDVGLMLDDVERGAAQWEAADLATTIQENLRAIRGTAGDRGVRQDAQHVLLGATMPAVLVEVGFIDHPIEGQELVDVVLQEKLADAIARAIVTSVAPH